MTCDIHLTDPLSRITRFWLGAGNNKRVRASETLVAVAFVVAGIDYGHLYYYSAETRESIDQRIIAN